MEKPPVSQPPNRSKNPSQQTKHKTEHPHDGKNPCEPNSHRDEKNHPNNPTTLTLREQDQMPLQTDHSHPLDPPVPFTFLALPT